MSLFQYRNFEQKGHSSKVESSPDYLLRYFPPPSLNRHGFSFTKVQLSLYFMSFHPLSFLQHSLPANIFPSPKGGR